jgi:hypothetical protein
MRASDIGGVSWPAATPVPGPSQQLHRLPLLPAAPAPGVKFEMTIAGHTSSSGDRSQNVARSSSSESPKTVPKQPGNVKEVYE